MKPESRSREREKILKHFNPEQKEQKEKGIFGLPFSPEISTVVMIPVPWEVTGTYSEGASLGPQAILEASGKINLYDENAPELWKEGFAMQKISGQWDDLNSEFRAKAKYIIDHLLGKQKTPESLRKEIYGEVGDACAMLNHWVKEESRALVKERQIPAVVGGDHSVPFGLIEALSENYDSFGILQIDAHADLKKSYQGFKFSHASVMYNVLGIKQLKHLVQVGVRDFSRPEFEYMQSNKDRIVTFTADQLQKRLWKGESWHRIAEKIIRALPSHVYISFDVSGLDPVNCPNTGIPVPGGLSFGQVVYMINRIHENGKKIIGFDLSEVSPGRETGQLSRSFDAQTGTRILYKLCGQAVRSNSQVSMQR